MSTEAYTSISNRVVSLEDIIRQQEQTIGAVLQRLRDVEQYAAAEARNREQAHQQLYQLLGQRGGSSAEAAQQMQAILQNQNERLGALQADVQGQAAALRGVDDKYEAALRGVEQRMQADVGGVHQRAQTGETASMEAMRNLQAQLQGVANATQAVDARSRDDLLGVQQQLTAELAVQRQRTDNLESAIRDALRDVHASLTGDLKSADTQHRRELDGAVQRINQNVEALDQRTRADMNQLHSVEQGDVSELSRRIEEMNRQLREMLQASTNGLTSEVAQVAQHSQNLDRRQAAAHQTLLQELAKHDAQLESVDLNWRASVTDLSAMVRDNVAAAQQQTAAGDQALQRQLKALDDRLTAATDAVTRNLSELNHAMQETCVKPVNEAQRVLSAHDQRLARVSDEYAAMQDSLKAFTSRVDQDAGQFKQVVEAAVRASHADLLERINFTSAAITMQQDPEVLRVEVNRALTKLWEGAKGAFLTQRNFHELQAQLATLESAVRVELCALAERHNELQRGVDAVSIAQHRAISEAGQKEALTPPSRESGSSLPSPLQHHSTTSLTSAATTSTSQAGGERASTPRVSTSPPLPSPVRHTTSAQTEKVPPSKARASLPDEPLPPPLPPLQAFTFEPIRRTQSPRPKVEEIDWDDETSHSRNEDGRVQSEQDIKALRASLNRLRKTQVEESDKASAAALLRMEDTETERDGAAAVAAARADNASKDAQRSASKAGGALHAAKTAATEASGAVRDAAGAAEQANASSLSALGAATQAGAASREARSAAAEAMESVRAAEAAQNVTVRVANELRQSLWRVQKLEESLQQRLSEWEARSQTDGARPTSAAPPTHASSRHSANTVVVRGPPSSGDDEDEDVDAEGAEQPRLYEEAEEPPHVHRVSAAVASRMSSSPKKKTGRPPPSSSSSQVSAPQPQPVPVSAQSSSDDVVEVLGISTGEVFMVRQDKPDRSTPASLRSKPSMRVHPTPLKESTNTLTAGAVVFPTKPATPSEGAISMPAPPPLPTPRRGSGLSEVLLPTHQFVRKREYGNFKDFTKQEIDALWVELLNLRRNQGMSKEEVLLQISQSKEQVLNTVLQIVQRQESEMLQMLSNIKMQLAELRSEPSAKHEVAVFPIDNGRHLEDFMRAISGAAPRAAAAVSEATFTTTPTDTSAAAPRRSPTRVDAATAFKVEPPPSPHYVPSSAPAQPQPQLQPQSQQRHQYQLITHDSGERVTSPSARLRQVTDKDTDTAASSGRSTTPLIPQIIPPVVQRRSSLPRRDDLSEVFFADMESGDAPRLVSKPQRHRFDSAPHLEATLTAPPPVHVQQHLYAVAAPVNPAAVAPASRPAEPESATAYYRPTGLVAPGQRVASCKGGSRPSSAKIDASRRMPLGSAGAPANISPHHISSPYVSTGVAGERPPMPLPNPLPHIYERDASASGDARRYLKEGKSPRNPMGSAFHLNPLEGLPANTHKSPPRREPGERHEALPREDPQESSRKVLEAEPQPHDSRTPRYQLIHVPPPSLPEWPVKKEKKKKQSTQVDTGDVAQPPGPLTDTSPEKYQPMSIGEGSDIYFESVDNQRPPRRAVRRSSTSTDNTPTHPSGNAPDVRATMPLGQMYHRQGSVPNRYSVPHSRGHTANPLSPRAIHGRGEKYGDKEVEGEDRAVDPHSPQYPPLLPPQQPRREHSPVREVSTDAVRTGVTPLSRSPSLHVLPYKGPIHLGAYNPPQPTEEREGTPSEGRSRDGQRSIMGEDANRSDRHAPPSSSSGGMHPHADHNPHVYAPMSARDWDVYSTAQSLVESPSPERGNHGRKSRHGSSATVVPVRVLDAPTNAPPPSLKKQNSVTTIRVHPYEDDREL